MAIEFLLVTFPEERAVLADGARVGFTNHTLMIPTGEYEITLEGGGCRPNSRDVALNGTSVVKPLAISFALSSAATAGGAGTRSRAGRG